MDRVQEVLNGLRTDAHRPDETRETRSEPSRAEPRDNTEHTQQRYQGEWPADEGTVFSLGIVVQRCVSVFCASIE